jgi:DNA-binding transcriptional MocR family regulator
MHLVVRLHGVDDAALVPHARRAGVALKSTRSHYLGSPRSSEFVFGFAEHSVATIDEGVRRLARALSDAQR